MSTKIQKILVSQPEPTNAKSPYFSLAENYHVSFDFKPFFRIEPVSVRDFRDQKINILDHTAIVLSSRTAVDHFFRLVKELRMTMPDDMKYFCSSEAVATYLQKYIVYRKRKIFFAPNGQSSELIQLIIKHPKECYFIPTTEGHKGDMVLAMEAKGIKHTTTIIYTTVYRPFDEQEISSYDMIVFFSPNGLAALQNNIPDYKQGNQLIASFGHKTTKALEEAGLKISVAAPSDEFHSMPAAIESLLSKKKK